MHSSAGDVNQDPPSPVAKAPDIGPHLNTFNTFGYQVASGMVRDEFQWPAGCYVCTFTCNYYLIINLATLQTNYGMYIVVFSMQ